MKQRKTVNAYAYRVDFDDVLEGDIAVTFYATRKAPRGSRSQVGSGRLALKLRIPPGVFIALAEHGRHGFKRMIESAEAVLSGQRRTLERFEKAAKP